MPYLPLPPLTFSCHTLLPTVPLSPSAPSLNHPNPNSHPDPSSLPIWRDEQRIFIHERAAGAYGTGAYFSATIVCDLIPYRILPPVVFTAIAYPMIGLAGPGRWPVFMLTLVLYNLVTSALCMLIGLVTTSNAVSNAAGR